MINDNNGAVLRDIGIQRSVHNAQKMDVSWTKKAYSFLVKYAEKHSTFMAEDVRLASEGIVPEPPSKRAWGYIFVMAKKEKLIESIGFKNVKNPKAHKTPATLWKVVEK